MKKLQIFVVVLLMGTLFSCSKKIDEATSELDEKLILSLVNDARESGCNCGNEYYPPVDPISWNDLLEEAAQNHSDDMYKKDFFSHTGSDGSSAGDRITEVKYEWSSYGENIAWGYASEEAVVQGWLESDGHCQNIMNGDLTEMGVAKRGDYWTMVLAKQE